MYKRSAIECVSNDKLRRLLTGKENTKEYICQVFDKSNGNFICILDGDTKEEVDNKYKEMNKEYRRNKYGI